MEKFIELFETWKNDKFYAEVAGELEALDEVADRKEIEDRFYKELEFGTAGLRGIMGAGTNRMNKFTVGKASAGFAAYLLEKYGKLDCKTRGVCISYDTRNNSREFSKIAADVLSSNGIKVYFHENPRPIPELSYSIRKFGAIGGVMVTASHNPKEYNGYKVYDETGCQLVTNEADKVTACVNKILSYKEINFNGNMSIIEKINITDEFVKVVVSESRLKDMTAKSNLNIVYTALHGTGLVPVTKALEADGFSQVALVESQSEPNGDFPTVVSPNPEDRHALELGIELAGHINADIVLGTDPDADRVGVAVKTTDGYVLTTGNQIGALLVDFILKNTSLPQNPVIVKSVVTSNFGAEIAKKHGVKVLNTLTGFKFIGERMNQFEEAKQQGNTARAFDYVMGYEESYGYLIGTHARDKDAIVSAMLISEMAASLKAQGKTLIDRLNELYAEYGYFLDCQDSFTLKGKEGLEKIKGIMTMLKNGQVTLDGAKVVDYSKGVPAESGFGILPATDMIIFNFKGGSWVAVRPSGTEPKIKIYYSIREKSEAHAKLRQSELHTTLVKKLGLN